MTDFLDDALLARYLEGTATPQERAAVERWAAADPAHASALAAFRETWERSGMLPSTRRVDAMWQSLSSRMHAPAATSQSPRPDRIAAPRVLTIIPRRPYRARWAVAAGVAAVFIGVVGLGIASRTRERLEAPSKPAPREYATARGERATIRLADGSTMILAADSRVRIPADYGSPVREVVLVGEAFFDVVHDTARAFRVRAQGAVVEDIGTRFDVRAYGDDSLVTVAVDEGAVALGRSRERAADSVAANRAAAEGLVLRRGDIGMLTASGRISLTRAGSLGDYMSWTTGRLEFRGAPLADVVRAIGRWYDIDVRVRGQSLAVGTVTASFAVQSPKEMLEMLALATNARVVRTGRSVELIPRQ